MEHVVFHHNGKEYNVYEMLTPQEIKTIMTMEEQRNNKLDPLNKKSTRKYFEDTDKMVISILRKCLHLSDSQILDIELAERRNLAHSFIRFMASANNLYDNRF